MIAAILRPRQGLRALQIGLSLLLVLVIALGTPAASQASAIPTFSIESVVTDSTVTIRTANFPAHRTFTVRMGEYGTYGKGGIVVDTFDSGAGGSFTRTFNIPDSLKGDERIAIRADGTGGYYAFNWFWNKTAPASTATPVPGYKGIPTFSITAVVKGEDVTIKTSNFPKDINFKVLMGKYGTKGVGGIEVATFNSGTGGAFSKTFDIPASLAGEQRIAIRAEGTGGFYAYNWFWNNTTDGAATPAPSDGTPVPAYTGIPTFSISAVVKDSKVTIKTNNFPAGLTFTVRMGAYGSLGLGGTVVTTFDSGAGGTFSKTFDIPAGLAGSQQIAIRADAPGGYYAFNWFWNNTTP